MSLTYVSAMINITIANMKTPQFAAYVGVTDIFLLMLFIHATGPCSGGHLNPLITFTTMVTGLSSFSRGEMCLQLYTLDLFWSSLVFDLLILGILYMIGQTTGGIISGALIRGSLGYGRAQL
jgi:glycerol uptake facilitator-like aquaporin